MRVIVIFVLLVVLGFVAFKAAERFKLIDPAPKEETKAAAETAQPEAPSPSLPSFDIVRVDRTGYAVIAGRAAPGSRVVIYANDAPIAETTAESDGSWAISTETPLEAGSVELTLEMTSPDGVSIKSDQTIIIYVPQREGDRPLVLRTTPGGATEVLQEPRDDGVGMGPLTLDTIDYDYDEQGAVIFAGRAEPGRVVQLFANKQFVGQATADEGGRWRLTATMPAGVYTLHIIQLDENGRPAYAIELPFERASLSEIELRDGKVIVQPGNSLWRIARRAYGRGIQYTIIYEANADQIRDPDLIYPGQIFEVPETPDDSGQ